MFVGGAWKFQGYDENGLCRSLEGRLTDGESPWRNLDRKFGSVKIEKMVSVLLQAA